MRALTDIHTSEVNRTESGDSYSSVGYTSRCTPPTALEPLGVAFPGQTSCERTDGACQEIAYDPNWVGHLLTAIRTIREQLPPLLVFDYANPGDTVARMKLAQVGRQFTPHAGTHPEWAPWCSSDSLFVTWIGVNDCTWNLRLQVPSAQASLDDLFATQETLYRTGARNFCLIDVPPAHVFPKGPKTPEAKAAYDAWKPLLREGAKAFIGAHPDATVFVFSSWDLFTRILADPQSYGLQCEDRSRSTLFVDGFHPTSAVHAIIAKELLSFLREVRAPSSSLLTNVSAS
ncbi:hypothetical protein GY45DRAFT_1033733 [Cubamyces sp. BRFM 1775]|nr:hypothetical protein GY45DRAFT_1033733 [Cubamyces sp. BRFM 1775]